MSTFHHRPGFARKRNKSTPYLWASSYLANNTSLIVIINSISAELIALEPNQSEIGTLAFLPHAHRLQLQEI
jgi:hypothetical protein